MEKAHEKILEAIVNNNDKAFLSLLKEKVGLTPIDINYKFQSGWAFLHYAAMHSGIQIFSRIINYQCLDVNSLTDFGETALHVAAKVNKTDHCSLLLGAGVCVDYRDKDLNTALHYAADLGHKAIVQVLLAEGASALLKNNRNLSAREMCSSRDMLSLFPGEEEVEREEANPLYRNRTNHKNMIEKMLASVKKEPGAGEMQESLRVEEAKEKMTAGQGRRQQILKLYTVIKECTVLEKVTLSTFKFYKKIGEGAFGEVYIVKREKSEKLYALKAIKKERVFGTSLYRYIQTEKDILSLINHPFIVRLHFAFQTESHLFLVMEYCPGGDLSKMLEKKKKFEEATVRKYACEILLGLEALHMNKIIYRDLKP